MTNKLPNRFSTPKVQDEGTEHTWHRGADLEICLYARSLQKAAKALVEKLEKDHDNRTDWDVCPIILLYREALEIYLKSLVGEGNNFLKNTKIDPISLSQTRSLPWLVQLVWRVIKAVGWQSHFTSKGIASLSDFRALVNQVDSAEPVGRAIRAKSTRGQHSGPQYYQTFDAVQFAGRIDGLLDLLDQTADALAAAWDQRADEVLEESDFTAAHISEEPTQ